MTPQAFGQLMEGADYQLLLYNRVPVAYVRSDMAEWVAQALSPDEGLCTAQRAPSHMDGEPIFYSGEQIGLYIANPQVSAEDFCQAVSPDEGACEIGQAGTAEPGEGIGY